MDVKLIRKRFEDYRAELELDGYELDRGLRAESRAREIRAEYGDVFSPDAREAVRKAEAEARKLGLHEDVRGLAVLAAGLTRAFFERELAPIDDSIRRHGRVVLVERDDGERAPLRDVRLLIAETDDGDERTRLESARIKAARDLAPLMAEKIGIEQGIARNLGSKDLVELWSALHGYDVGACAAFAEEILAGTDDLYRDVMGWTVKKRLGVELADARRCDVPYVFAARYREYEECFTVEDMVAKARDFLSKMRVDLTAGGKIRLEVEAPSGPPRAFVGAIRIPHDVRMALEIGEGQRDWLAFLDTLGRALFYANIDPELPFEFRALGDGSIDLAYSTLFKNLLLDREWLKRSLGFARPKDYLVLAYLERLYDLRLTAGRLIYDLALRRSGSVEGMEDRFESEMRRAVGIRYPRELYLHDVRTALYSALKLRARLYEALFVGHLVHYFDVDWWRNPRCGPFLTKQWAIGRRFRVDELAKEIGYPDGLTVRPLVKLFQKNL